MDTSGDLDDDGVCDDLDSCQGDDATGDMDSDGVCANSDCNDDDPAIALIGPCGVCGGDGTTCSIFEDGFELGDTSAWSHTSP
jgi:hypothetical protein